MQHEAGLIGGRGCEPLDSSLACHHAEFLREEQAAHGRGGLAETVLQLGA